MAHYAVMAVLNYPSILLYYIKRHFLFISNNLQNLRILTNVTTAMQ